MSAEEHREANDAYFGAASGDHVTCPECGRDDVSSRTRTFEEPSGRVLDGETAFRCNHCEYEWIEA